VLRSSLAKLGFEVKGVTSEVLTAKSNASNADQVAHDAYGQAAIDQIMLDGLQKSLLNFASRLQPRRIEIQTRDKFIALTKDAPKSYVRIVAAGEDNETLAYARQIREMLDAAGFGNGSNSVTGVKGLNYFPHIGDPAFDTPFDIFFYGPEGEDRMDCPSFSIYYDETNKWMNVNIVSNNVAAIPAIIFKAFIESGLHPGLAKDNMSLNKRQEDWCIFIHQKF
jgi:hypothetical protein